MGIPRKFALTNGNRKTNHYHQNNNNTNGNTNNHNNPASYPRTKDERIFFAQLAAAAGRHQDVIDYLSPLLPYSLLPPRSVSNASSASSEIRSLLSVAYKNLTNNLRTSWRIVHSIEVAASPRHAGIAPHKNAHRVKVELTGEARKKVEGELREMCERILKLVGQMLHLLDARGKGLNVEERVFWLKMKGDYLRYLIEISQASDDPSSAAENIKEYEREAFESYRTSFELSQDDSSLEAIHPTRLGIGLNFAVFYHDVKQSPIRAIHVAKFVFDTALEGILRLQDPEIVAKLCPRMISYDHTNTAAVATTDDKESNRMSKIVDALLILQILKDDIVVWSGEVV